MDNLFTKKVPLYFETDESQLVVGDSFKILTKMEPESVDMIFADPPYFLSNAFVKGKELEAEDFSNINCFELAQLLMNESTDKSIKDFYQLAINGEEVSENE